MSVLFSEGLGRLCDVARRFDLDFGLLTEGQDHLLAVWHPKPWVVAVAPHARVCHREAPLSTVI